MRDDEYLFSGLSGSSGWRDDEDMSSGLEVSSVWLASSFSLPFPAFVCIFELFSPLHVTF